jgi:hypothetical protein
MKARKLQYSVDYTHILTFREHYKQLVYPAFGRENTQYAIDGENTQFEGIRLIFPVEAYVLQLRRDGMTLIYEGDISFLKRSNVATDTFFEIYERIKRIPEYTKTARQKINIDFVELRPKEEYERQLKNNTFISKPISNLKEYAVLMEFSNGGLDYQMKFGNFSENDIDKSNLSPLNTEYNRELRGKFGFLTNINVSENTQSVSHSKMKDLISAAEATVQEYMTLNNGK